MGNNPCGQITTSYKVPFNAVNKDYNNFQFIEYRQYFHYPGRYPYILSYLRKNNLLFEDMYFPVHEYKKILGSSILKQTGQEVQWKRINHILHRNNIRFSQILFHQQPQTYKQAHSLYRLLLWVTTTPSLMKKMFLFETINQEGLVLVYLPLNGSHDQPVEIVIDDQIPMKNQLEYFSVLPQTNNVAMVLLEKALAKVLGSYQKLRMLPMKDLFEMIVGLPVLMENPGSKDPLQNLSRYYQPSYSIVSHNKKLQNHRPEYFKFSLETESSMAISIWQLLQNPHSLDSIPPAQIVIQLMMIQSESRVARVAYSSRLHKDKTFLRTVAPEQQKLMFGGRDFLNLKRGSYLLHIYTNTQSISANVNLILYSSCPLNLTYRKQNPELNSYKMKMIENVFLQHNKQLEKCPFTEGLYSKFIWDGFRGILAFKSEEPVRIKVTLLIKAEYRRKIKFQHTEQYEDSIFMKPHSSKTISFVKFTDSEVGNFYEQSISYLKQDMLRQGLQPNFTNYPRAVNPNQIQITSSRDNNGETYTYRQQQSFMSESKEFLTPNNAFRAGRPQY